MERNIASPALAEDTRSSQLIDFLEELQGPVDLHEPVLYYDFPIFRDTDDVLYRSKVLMTSRRHGVVLFAVGDTHDPRRGTEDIQRLDDELVQLHSLIVGKLLKSRLLRRRPGILGLDVSSYLYLPDLKSADAIRADVTSDVIISREGLERALRAHEALESLTPEQYAELRAILEGAKGLVRARERDVSHLSPTSRAVLLKDLESEIHNFDTSQRRAAISIVDGPQRIRGLAGSGKTVVLAMKAAHLHLQDPTRDILVTFYTKSLYDHIRRLITRFYRQFNDRDPDWSRVHVRHAWGGRDLGGVYYNAATQAGIAPLTLRDARARSGSPFEYAVAQLLATTSITPQYDYVLLDEAQDFPPVFFRLCFALCRGGAVDRNVVWAYDDLQNIISVRLKSARELFGDENGVPRVDLERAQGRSPAGLLHDIVLRRSYRNPREVLVCAHALGFGIYGPTIVQMLENAEHWRDVGYVVRAGGHPTEPTVVERPAENSPLSISRHQTVGQLIGTHVADSAQDEARWVVDEIRAFLADGLRADDLMVIALDDRNARRYFETLSVLLAEHGIHVNNVLADPYGPPSFIVDGCITLTTVYRAKGNEAAVVFALGVDAIAPERRLRQARNKLFTAFTRAKAWLRISGIGTGAAALAAEVNTAIANLPELRFVYPNLEDVELLQRDLTDKQARLHQIRETVEREMDKLGLTPEEQAEYVQTLLSQRK